MAEPYALTSQGYGLITDPEEYRRRLLEYQRNAVVTYAPGYSPFDPEVQAGTAARTDPAGMLRARTEPSLGSLAPAYYQQQLLDANKQPIGTGAQLAARNNQYQGFIQGGGQPTDWWQTAFGNLPGAASSPPAGRSTTVSAPGVEAMPSQPLMDVPASQLYGTPTAIPGMTGAETFGVMGRGGGVVPRSEPPVGATPSVSTTNPLLDAFDTRRTPGDYYPGEEPPGGQPPGGTTLDAASLQKLLDSILPLLGSQYQTAAKPNPLAQTYQSLYGKVPYPQLLGDLGAAQQRLSTGPTANVINQAVGGLGSFYDSMLGNLGYLSQYGLPGSQQLEQERGRLGLEDLGGKLLGGNVSNYNYGVMDLLNQIYSLGLPGQRTVEGLVPGQEGFGAGQQGRASDIFGGLLGGRYAGTLGEYGQGLLTDPRQARISGAVEDVGRYGRGYLDRTYGFETPGILGTVGSQLEGLIQGGGLTPEYVQAQRERLLDPAMEALQGRLNRQGMGVAAPSSGLFAELQRRSERDFTNQMISEGYQNLGRFMEQGTNLGDLLYRQQLAPEELGLESGRIGAGLLGTGADLESTLARSNLEAMMRQGALGADIQNQLFGQELGAGQAIGGQGERALDRSISAFGAVPEAVYPFVAQGADLSQGLLDRSLGRYDVGSGRGLENIRTISDIADQMLGRGQRQTESDVDRQLAALTALLGGGQQFLTGQQNLGVTQQDQLMSLLRSYLSGEQQKSIAELQAEAAKSAATRGAVGGGLGGLFGLLAALVFGRKK